MQHGEFQYLNLLKKVLNEGIDKNDRTGVGVRGIFGSQMKFDLSKGDFPLITTKKTFLRGIIVELIWLIRGETNIKYLVDRNVHIWDEWPFQNWLDNSNEVDPIKYPKYSKEWLELKKEWVEKMKNLEETNEWVLKWGDLGPVYGHQWRNFGGGGSFSSWVKDISKRQWGIPGGVNALSKTDGIDQLKQAIDKIKNKPTDRRIIVSARNPLQFDMMLLPPCHMFYQFNVDTTNNKLNLQMYQRSADMFLGVPFNIASYSALLLIIAKLTGLEPGEFTHTLGDAHIYSNHFDQVNTQLSRKPFPFPKLEIKKEVNSIKDIENLEWEDFDLIGYKSHEKIKAPVAV